MNLSIWICLCVSLLLGRETAAMEASVVDNGDGGEDLEDEMLQRALMESMNQGPFFGGDAGNSNF